MDYTWDEKKQKKVYEEHKVDFAKIKDVFSDPFAIEYEDKAHSTSSEIRFAIIGLTAEYGLVYEAFTEPAEDEIHFVTARKAENWMVKRYDKKRGR